MNKILIIEDNKDLNEAYEIIFRVHGFDPVMAIDGDEGINKAKDFTGDVILVDLMMPKFDGYSVIESIRSRDSDSVIIVNSNLCKELHVKRCFDVGASHYIRKSDYTADELAEKVKEFLIK